MTWASLSCDLTGACEITLVALLILVELSSALQAVTSAASPLLVQNKSGRRERKSKTRFFKAG